MPTTLSSAAKYPLYFLDFDGTCTTESGEALFDAAYAAGDMDRNAEALFNYTENKYTNEQGESTIADLFRPGVAEMFLNYFEYLGSNPTNPTLEIFIVTNNYNLYVYKVLEALVKERRPGNDQCIQGLTKFFDSIDSTTRHQGDNFPHPSRSKKYIIRQRFRQLERTGTSADFFGDDSQQEIQNFRQAQAYTTEIELMTIGDEKDFSEQLDRMNALIRGETSASTTANETVHDSKEESTTGDEIFSTPPTRMNALIRGETSASTPANQAPLDSEEGNITNRTTPANQTPLVRDMNALIRGELSPDTTANETVLDSEEENTSDDENASSTPPTSTNALTQDGINETTSTCAEFFKKRKTEFIALGMFGSFSSLGILAYLQDGMCFLDGLKDIPNNAPTLILAIFGGFCIALLIATAVAACRSGRDNTGDQTGLQLGLGQ
jgi:hypothetical protein